MAAWGLTPEPFQHTEPYIPEPPDPSPECPVCGGEAWDDRIEKCGDCGATIEDVAERIANRTR